MYFPFIRAKQYDLIALSEIADNIIESGKVIPIIEPVNDNNYLFRYLGKFIEKNMPFVFITNPTEGNLVSKPEFIKKEIVDKVIDEYDNYFPAYIITTRTTLEDITNFLKTYSNNQVCFIHYYPFKDAGNLIEKFGEYGNISYQIFYENKVSPDYISKFSNDNKVILKNEFSREKRNADYAEQEYYSNSYKRYDKDGYVGFGDFTVMGDHFISGSGGPAYAVAIHYTYVNHDDHDNLWMKHFVSDDQEGPKNPDGKFLQALNKCVAFFTQNNPLCKKCIGCKDFMSYHNTKHFPGLGTVKKLSLEHHIELIMHLI